MTCSYDVISKNVHTMNRISCHSGNHTQYSEKSIILPVPYGRARGKRFYFSSQLIKNGNLLPSHVGKYRLGNEPVGKKIRVKHIRKIDPHFHIIFSDRWTDCALTVYVYAKPRRSTVYTAACFIMHYVRAMCAAVIVFGSPCWGQCDRMCA